MQVDTTHPFHCACPLVSTDYDDEDNGKYAYRNLHNRPNALFFLPPVIMMTWMMHGNNGNGDDSDWDYGGNDGQ